MKSLTIIFMLFGILVAFGETRRTRSATTGETIGHRRRAPGEYFARYVDDDKSVETPGNSEEDSDEGLLRNMFDDLDENSDGYLTRKEVEDFWKNKGNNEDHTGYFDRADINKDGKITFEEFKEKIGKEPKPALSHRRREQDEYFARSVDDDKSVETPDKSEEDPNEQSEEGLLRNMFDDLDENSDGYLTRKEVEDFWKNKGNNEDHTGYFDRADVNKDGKITFEEFKEKIGKGPKPTIYRRHQFE